MYKIYINETPLLFTTEKPDVQGEWLITHYRGKTKFLHHYIDLLEKTSRYEGVCLYAPDVHQLFADFASLYRLIDAAGGVVYNSAGEVLFIHRRGYWDLPKGKVDKGETIEMAALREVQEETGLVTVQMKQALGVTRHTYKDHKERRILKTTYWFDMLTSDTELVPQAEEDIEKAVWIDPANFPPDEYPAYASILDVLQRSVTTS